MLTLLIKVAKNFFGCWLQLVKLPLQTPLCNFLSAFPPRIQFCFSKTHSLLYELPSSPHTGFMTTGHPALQSLLQKKKSLIAL